MDDLREKSKGCGIGLRSQHYPVITSDWPKMDWFEAISENYMDTGGRPLKVLEKVRSRYPIALHGTALSIGSTDPLNEKYLERLKRLADAVDPFIVSDHLCWSGAGGEVLHDLLPLPFTESSVRHIVSRVARVQEALKRPILLENVSTYVTYRHNTMPEWVFLTEVARRSGCKVLLDVNNVYVNSVNHGFDPSEYLRNVPAEFVRQIHLSGHTDMGDFLFDTHSMPILDKVWSLYREALELYGAVSTLIEWDENIPPFEELDFLAKKARVLHDPFVGSGVKQACAPAKTARIEISVAAGSERSLEEIQTLFKDRIKAHHEAGGQELDIFLNPQGRSRGSERVAVYAGGYTARIHEALSQVYEAVRKAIGEEAFSELAHVYADRYPSLDYNLNFAGREVPELLKKSPYLKDLPYLPDLAAMEWRVWQAFNAFDAVPFSPERMDRVPPEAWEGAHLLFQPSVSLFSSEWPVLDLWLARQKEASGAYQHVVPSPQKILIGRKAEQVRCELLSASQYRLLEDLLSGRSLGEACEILAQSSDSDLPVANWFFAWVRDGLIRDCRVQDPAAVRADEP
jgi:uncharacterized protein (UPF0276 family)